MVLMHKKYNVILTNVHTQVAILIININDHVDSASRYGRNRVRSNQLNNSLINF